MKDSELYLRLLSYVKPYWRLFLLSIVCMALFAVTDPIIASMMKPLMDGAFIENDEKTKYWLPIIFVAVFFVRGLFTYISRTSLYWVANKVITDLRAQIFSKLMLFPCSYYDQNNSGTIISKFTYDVTQVKQAATGAVTTIVRDSLSILGLILWMLYLNWQLCLIVLLSAPLIMIVMLIIRKRLRKMSHKVQDIMGDINQVLNESIEGHKLIKLYDGNAQENERFLHVINDYRHFEMKFALAAYASSPIVQFIVSIIFAIIIIIATGQSAIGNLTVGEFVSFFGAMAMVLGPLKRLVQVNVQLQRGLAGCESIFAMLDAPVETDSIEAQTKPIIGNIEFKDVTFSYESSDSNALHKLSFKINAGQTIALVGASGSGKSTIANLLPNFYNLTSGQILINGNNINDISLSELRKNIAFVSQDVVLFNDTVRKNIAFGELRGYDENKIIEAAKYAYAMEFINELPEGLDTIIGEKGLKLSGGQRQRLAIARALLKDAPILILDEATSSLDTESESQIQNALDQLKQGRTCLIIAHRLSTVRNADNILVLEEGNIVETGTHDELMEKNGVYASLHQIILNQPDYRIK